MNNACLARGGISRIFDSNDSNGLSPGRTVMTMAELKFLQLQHRGQQVHMGLLQPVLIPRQHVATPAGTVGMGTWLGIAAGSPW